MKKCYGCGHPDYRHVGKPSDFCKDGCVWCDCTCFELAPPKRVLEGGE